MLSQYTVKFIQLLKDEASLYEWGKSQTKVFSFDLEGEIKNRIEERNVAYASSKLLFHVLTHTDYAGRQESSFGDALINSRYWNYTYEIYDWLNGLATDEEKKRACLFLAKTINRIQFSLDKFPNSLNMYNTFSSIDGFVSDFESLPLKEVFLKTDDIDVDSIEHSTWSGFANFDNNHSFYAEHNNNFSSYDEKEQYIKWMLLPKDIAVQKTPYSYTQVGVPNLEDDGDLSFPLKGNLIYFKDGYVEKVTTESSEDFAKQIIPLEEYALKIQEVSKYSVVDMNINVMLDRLSTAANITSAFTRKAYENYPTESLSYKLIFSIAEQQSVVVPSVDMFQSVLYLKAMGSDQISLFYDPYEKRIVIKGKSQELEIKTLIESATRTTEAKYDIKKEIIPTFSIIYEQKVSELTSFTPIEYVEFFNPTLTFRDKYDLLNTKRSAPLQLPSDFEDEYPAVAESYSQQSAVALSNKSRDEKYEYVSSLIQEYLNSYTEIISAEDYWDVDLYNKLIAEEQSKNHRIAIKTDEWEVGNYVFKS